MSAIDDVYTLVQDDIKRPDLQARIWRRIHRSILNYHHMDMWARDLEEQTYQFSIPNTAVPQVALATGSNGLFMNSVGQQNPQITVQVINLADLIRYRFLRYLRKWATVDTNGNTVYDPTTGQQGTVQGGDLTERSPDTMFDGYGYDARDTYYKSGNTIRLSASTPLSKVYIGYFKNPIVNVGCETLDEFQLYESWIVDMYPDLIVCDVKARMFTATGKTEEANSITKGGGELAAEILRLQTNEVRTGMR